MFRRSKAMHFVAKRDERKFSSVVDTTLSFLTWSIDASEHDFFKKKRLLPKSVRFPEICNTIAMANTDIVLLQDSSEEFARKYMQSICGEKYEWVDEASAPLFPAGSLQLFQKKASLWKAKIDYHCAFLTFQLRHLLSTSSSSSNYSFRISNVDFRFPGSALDAENTPLPGQEILQKREQMVEYLNSVSQSDFVLGNTCLKEREIVSEYDDAFLLAGSPSEHEHTTSVIVRDKQSRESGSHQSKRPTSTAALHYFVNARPPHIFLKRNRWHRCLVHAKKLGIEVREFEILRPSLVKKLTELTQGEQWGAKNGLMHSQWGTQAIEAGDVVGKDADLLVGISGAFPLIVKFGLPPGKY